MRGLIEGIIYEFRVKAVNKAGESESSDPSLPHRARPKNSAPRIDRNAMMDIKIHAEEPLLLNIPVDGEPLPMKNWSLNGRDIADSMRMMIINEDYRTTIRVNESKRSDTGTYNLWLRTRMEQTHALAMLLMFLGLQRDLLIRRKSERLHDYSLEGSQG